MRLLRLSVLLCVFALFLFTATLLVRLHDQREIERIARETNESLCALKEDLQDRHDSLQELLLENPDGVLGIPRKVLQRTLEDRRSVLDALSNLQCDPPTEGGT